VHRQALPLGQAGELGIRPAQTPEHAVVLAVVQRAHQVGPQFVDDAHQRCGLRQGAIEPVGLIGVRECVLDLFVQRGPI